MAVFVACRPGTYNANEGSSSPDDCLACLEGKANPTTGAQSSAHCVACMPGTIAPSNGSASCMLVAAGSYQSSAGMTASVQCNGGSYCPEGAASPLPCLEGTFSNATNLTSAGECTRTQPGFAAPTRSVQQTACAQGTIAPVGGLGACSRCDGGSYQDADGATACKLCEPGYYCPQGAAAALPCPGGTASNVSGLHSEIGCLPVPFGSWAPTGSAEPIACPSSGFSCPGALDTQAYLAAGIAPPGSQPIALEVGFVSATVVQSEQLPSLKLSLALEQSLDDFDGVAFRAALARVYGVPPSRIDFEISEISAGSVVVAVHLIVSNDAQRTSLVRRVETIEEAELTHALGGVRAVRAPSMVMASANVTRMVTTPIPCPLGHWCTAGATVACTSGTYNNATNADLATACRPCPSKAASGVASTSIDQCYCEAGYYDTAGTKPVECVPCFIGTACTSAYAQAQTGVTLATLPIAPGYYRLSNASSDVRRCPDAAANCSDAPECPETTSGCVGTLAVDAPAPPESDGTPAAAARRLQEAGEAGSRIGCHANLTGVFCRLCSASLDGVKTYYSAATSGARAQCKECRNAARDTLLWVSGLLLALATAATVLRCTYLSCLSTHRRGQLTHAWHKFTPHVKLKILFGFYIIATKIPTVYEVELPPDVKRMLDAFSLGVSLGLSSADAVLECLGLRGYESTLALYTFAPVACALAIVLVGLARECCGNKSAPTPSCGKAAAPRTCGKTAARTATALLEWMAPYMLQMLFVFYPLVTNVAFDAFSCYEFREGSWLKADVSIRCGSPRHERATTFAWAAIVVYPIGLLVLNAALLTKARHTIRSREPSVFTIATAFLHREYEPHFFWWELVEMGRRFVLVGLLILYQDTMMQLILGTLLAATFLLVQLVASPYKETTDDLLASSSSFCLVVLFLVSIIFKYEALTGIDDIRGVLSSEQKGLYVLSSLSLTLVALAAVGGAIFLSMVIFVVQVGAEGERLRREARNAMARRLRWQESGNEVEPPPIEADHFHIFLSHVWGTGQDQMRIIKQRLLEMIPELRVFLDVDDMKEGRGAEYLDRSQLVVIFVSDGYFTSPNCMRELLRAVYDGKPVQSVMESDPRKGGLTREQVLARLQAADDKYFQWGLADEMEAWGFPQPSAQQLHDVLYDACEPIEWTRIGFFQDVTLRLMVEALLRNMPEHIPSARCMGVKLCSSRAPKHRASRASRPGAKVPRVSHGKTYVQGEISSLSLPPIPHPSRAYHVFSSQNNPGGMNLLAELSRRHGLKLTGGPVHSRGFTQSFTVDSLMLIGKAAYRRARSSPKHSPRGKGQLGFRSTLHVTSRPTDMASCDHFLVYLTGEPGEQHTPRPAPYRQTACRSTPPPHSPCSHRHACRAWAPNSHHLSPRQATRGRAARRASCSPERSQTRWMQASTCCSCTRCLVWAGRRHGTAATLASSSLVRKGRRPTSSFTVGSTSRYVHADMHAGTPTRSLLRPHSYGSQNHRLGLAHKSTVRARARGQIALPLKGGAWREASLVLLYQILAAGGASEDGSGWRCCAASQLACTSSNLASSASSAWRWLACCCSTRATQTVGATPIGIQLESAPAAPADESAAPIETHQWETAPDERCTRRPASELGEASPVAGSAQSKSALASQDPLEPVMPPVYATGNSRASRRSMCLSMAGAAVVEVGAAAMEVGAPVAEPGAAIETTW